MTATPYVSVEFCDTNVLAYAHDTTAGRKRETARALVERLWHSETGAVSIQVLQELFTTLTRKLSHPLAWQTARAVVAELTAWQVVVPGPQDVLDAIDGAARWQVSFWDALVLTTALKSNADVVWSEDLNDGQMYDGLPVQNPFAGGR
jgi:predicted nucleic acid-binding protein